MGEGKKKDLILEDNMIDGGTSYTKTIVSKHVASTKTSNNDITN